MAYLTPFGDWNSRGGNLPPAYFLYYAVQTGGHARPYKLARTRIYYLQSNINNLNYLTPFGD